MGEHERLVAHMRLLKTRADLAINDFETAIEQHGNDLLWEKAFPCACRNHDQGDNPKPGCPVCNGVGQEYWGGQVIRGVIAALDLDQQAQVAYGTWNTGTASVTVRGEHQPGFRDRYTNTQGVARFDEWAVRKAPVGALERLRYPIAGADYMLHHPAAVGADGAAVDVELQAAALRLADSLSRLTDDMMTRRMVLRLRLIDPETRNPGLVLEQGADFDVVDGRIDWTRGEIRGTAPAVGQRFGISYLHHPRYLVTMFNHVSRDQLVLKKSPEPRLQRFPVAVVAKLDYLMQGDANGS